MEGIPAEELVEYFASAAEGLDFLHSKHVFHRDIKPDNILLVNGHAKVADFGLARAGPAGHVGVIRRHAGVHGPGGLGREVPPSKRSVQPGDRPTPSFASAAGRSTARTSSS